MPNEMNHAEVAKRLLYLDSQIESDDDVRILVIAATDERRIANGELVQLSCKMIVPNGLRDCAGSRNEWFKQDFCEQCRKYHSYGKRKGGGME